MKREKIFWTDFGVFVCTKCQKKIVMPPSDSLESVNLAENIKTHFKNELNTMGLKGKVRVMTTSCLGVCPEGYQALSIVSTTDASISHSIAFNPFTETELVLEEIKKVVRT